MGARIRAMYFAAIGMLLLCGIAMEARAATITVTNTSDSGPGSLRQALAHANDGDTITFAISGTITLTSGGLPITKNLTISGPGADQLSIDGSQALLVLGIFPDKTATISGLTIRNGQVGIWNEQGTLAISNCSVNLNSVGGLFNAYGLVNIVNSTISGNSAADGGGAICNHAGAMQIANSTINGNSAGSGGGVYNVPDQFGAATIETGNTIFNRGASGENIFNNGGTITSDGYNVCSDDGGGYLNGLGDQVNIDALLGPLQDNGGPTLTHLPLSGSPAIDAGDPNFTPPPCRDQRGRVFGRRIDVGSVEKQPRPRCPTPAPRPTPH